MLGQIDVAFTFDVFYVASKIGKTGLTVTVDIYKVVDDGSSSQIVTGGSATEIGGGNYAYTLASGSVDEKATYLAVFKTADGTVDQQHLRSKAEVGNVADIVWDEALTGATHNINGSSGRRLRELASQVVYSGIAQGAGANGNQIQLDTGASAIDGAYDPSAIAIVGEPALARSGCALNMLA